MKLRKGIDLQLLRARIKAEGASALLSRGEASALIAERVMDPHDNVRGARNRIGLQMDRACAKGSDVTAGGLFRTAEGHCTVDEISRWAGRNYGQERFADLPTTPRVSPGRIEERIEVNASAEMSVLPGSLEKCHELVQRLIAENKELVDAARKADQERRHKLGMNFKKK